MFTDNAQLDAKYRGYNPEFARRARQRQKMAETARKKEQQKALEAKKKEEAKRRVEAMERIRGLAEEAHAMEYRLLSHQKPTAKALIIETALVHKIGYLDIMSKSRAKMVVTARHAAIREVADAYPEYSLTRIARLFGLDHTTVLAALNKTKKPGATR